MITISTCLSDYDTLECPFCDKPCKPARVYKSGAVKYEKHWCTSGGFGGFGGYRSFSIGVNGDLIDS